MSNDTPNNDPLGLNAVDREIRINELAQQAQEMGIEHVRVSRECPPEVEEQFLKGMIDFESCRLSTKFQQLVDAGVDLPEPDKINDADMHSKLWELIHALAKHDSYLHHTNHLSDRELYSELWHDILREENPVMPPGSGWVNGIDMIGGGSEEDIQIGLRYYDNEEQRAWWAKEFPKDVIPPHEDPPYDRDRHLPKSPHDFIVAPDGDVDGICDELNDKLDHESDAEMDDRGDQER